MNQPPITFKDWSRLTPEIKTECVKHLDFLTKIKLRNMSRSDRAVVNSTRFDVERVSLTKDEYGQFLEIEVSGEEKLKMMAESPEVLADQLVPLLAFVMKSGTIDSLACGIDDLPEQAIGVLGEIEQLRFRNISGTSSSQMMLFLERCAGNMVESVSLGVCNGRPMPFDRVMAIDSLRNVKLWKLRSVEQYDCITKMAQRWIENDADVGTELNITLPRLCGTAAFMNFGTTFRDRIECEEAGKKYRIRMTPDKHISLHNVSLGEYTMWIRSARSRSPPRRPHFRIVQ